MSRLRAGRQQFGDVLDQVGQDERTAFEFDLAGFDLGIVEQFLDQGEQGIAGCLDRPGIRRLFGRERGVEQQSAHADDAVQWRAKLMRGHCEKARLGPVGRVRVIARFCERALGLHAARDITADALQFRRMVGVDPHQAFAPCDPARAERGFDPLIVDAGTVRFKRTRALLENGEHEPGSEQLGPRTPGESAIGVVHRGDNAPRIAQDDQVALRFEQAARPFLRFLQLPIPVRERFVVKNDLAKLSAHPAQAHAEDGQRDAGQREKQAHAERKGVWVVISAFGSGNEAVGASERDRESRKGPKDKTQAGMSSDQPAQPRPEPEQSRHHQPPKVRRAPGTFRQRAECRRQEHCDVLAAEWENDVAKCLRDRA